MISFHNATFPIWVNLVLHLACTFPPFSVPIYTNDRHWCLLPSYLQCCGSCPFLRHDPYLPSTSVLLSTVDRIDSVTDTAIAPPLIQGLPVPGSSLSLLLLRAIPWHTSSTLPQGLAGPSDFFGGAASALSFSPPFYRACQAPCFFLCSFYLAKTILTLSHLTTSPTRTPSSLAHLWRRCHSKLPSPWIAFFPSSPACRRSFLSPDRCAKYEHRTVSCAFSSSKAKPFLIAFLFDSMTCSSSMLSLKLFTFTDPHVPPTKMTKVYLPTFILTFSIPCHLF